MTLDSLLRLLQDTIFIIIIIIQTSMLSLVRNAVVMFGALGVANAIADHTGEQAAPVPTLEDLGSIGAQERFVGFQTCSPSMSLVHSVVVRAHDAGSTSLESSGDSSMVFRSGRYHVYTLNLLLLPILMTSRVLQRLRYHNNLYFPCQGPSPKSRFDSQ